MLIMTLSLKLKQDQFCEYKANFVTKCGKILFYLQLWNMTVPTDHIILSILHLSSFLEKSTPCWIISPNLLPMSGQSQKQKEHERRFSKGFYQESPAYDWLSLKKAFKV